MSHFNRLGGNMDEANAECAEWEQDVADKADAAHTAALVAGVKAHATANYNEGGWDMVVECMEDAEIAEEVAGCETVEAAIAEVGKTASLYAERRQEAWSEGGLDMNGREPHCEELSHSPCTCRDSDDMCDFCSYTAWKADMEESGVLCEDGGYRAPKVGDYSQEPRRNQDVCFLSQQECEDDNIPF